MQICISSFLAAALITLLSLHTVECRGFTRPFMLSRPPAIPETVAPKTQPVDNIQSPIEPVSQRSKVFVCNLQAKLSTNDTSLDSKVILRSFASVVPSMILKNKIPEEAREFKSMKEAMKIMMLRNTKILVEAGRGRCMEYNDLRCSSAVFGNFAKILDSCLYSVDDHVEGYDAALELTKLYSRFVKIIKQSPVEYLLKFDAGLIDFLYLDASDPDENDSDPQSNDTKEIEVVYNKLHRNSIIMLHGCLSPLNKKCAAIQEFLLKQQWQIHYDSRHPIFIHTTSSNLPKPIY